MKIARLASSLLAVFAIIAPVFAQPRVSAVYSPLAADFQINSNGTPASPPMYAPALWQTSNGSLGMITHGSCLGQCPSDGTAADALFRWRRSPGGSWSAASGGLTPSKFVQTTSLGETIPAGALRPFTEPSANFSYGVPCQSAYNNAQGVFGNPGVVKVGSKLFMTFHKGNGDFWTGEVWFAVSGDDGASWSVYPNPIFYPLYHRWHAAPPGCNEGFVGPVGLTTVDVGGKTWFHVYAGYAHPTSEYPAEDYSIIDYRWEYNPAHSYGFSAAEVYYNGAYQPHSGRLVWTYDSGSAYGTDIKLNPSLLQAPWGAGTNIWQAGTVTTQTIGSQTYKLMVVEGWRFFGDPIRIKTSCDGITWSAPINVDVSLVNTYHPGKIVVENGIWYGTLGNVTSLWGFLSLGQQSGSGTFDGTRILPVKLDGVVPTCL
jgi:hypothetical protein